MHVPVTDAFDSTDSMEPVEVALTPKQIEWLERKAEERSVSVDHMLRSLITEKIREGSAAASSSPSGDGAPFSSPNDDADTETTASDDSSTTTIFESLQTASEQLQDLTDDETAADAESPDTLSQLRARLDTSSDAEDASSDSPPESALVDSANRSMFDLMDDEE